MKHSRRDIRAERQARDLTKRFGWGAPMPGEDSDCAEPGYVEALADAIRDAERLPPQSKAGDPPFMF